MRGWSVALIDFRETVHRGSILGQLTEQVLEGFLWRCDEFAGALMEPRNAFERVARGPGSNVEFGSKASGRCQRDPCGSLRRVSPFLDEQIRQERRDDPVSLLKFE